MSERLTQAEADALFRQAQPVHGEPWRGQENIVAYVLTPELFNALRIRVAATIKAEARARTSANVERRKEAP